MNPVIHMIAQLRRLCRDRGGAALIELAICMPVIAGMIIPLADLSMGVYTQMQIVDAVQAGAQYAAVNDVFDTSMITYVAQQATGLQTVTLAPAPVKTCGCLSTDGTTVVATACTGACPSGTQAGTLGTYVTVAASTTYHPLFNYAFLPTDANGNMQLSSIATLRMR